MTAAAKEAVISGEDRVLLTLITNTPSIVHDPIDDDDTTLLHLAAVSTNTSIHRLLLDNNAKLNTQNKDGFTPLHVAAMNGCTQSLEVLLEYGADPTLLDSDGLTPLDHAEDESYWQCVQLLEQYCNEEEGDKVNGDSSDGEAEMSMCEAYVNMVLAEKSMEEDDHTHSINHAYLLDQSGNLKTDVIDNDHTLLSNDRSVISANNNRSRQSSHSKYSSSIILNDFTDQDPINTTDNGGNDNGGNNTICIKNSITSLYNTTHTNSNTTTCTTTTTTINDIHDETIVADLTLVPPHDSLLYNAPSVSDIPKSCDLSRSLTDQELRQKLIDLGEDPGPVNNLTRGPYLKYLDKLLKGGIQPASNQGHKGFKYELALCLNGTVAVPDLHREENAIFTEFRSRGQAKTFFNYLLLDPTILKSLDTTLLNDHNNDDVMFRSFVEAIFYIGKGKHSRSLQHLKDAKKGSQVTPSGHVQSKKVKRILEIWNMNEGVLSLHVFSNIAAGEAYNREAAMIECIGIQNLTNVVKGHYHGTMGRWGSAQRRRIGVYFLQKAFKSFIIDIPQKIFSEDI